MFLKLTRNNGNKVRVNTEQLNYYDFQSETQTVLTVNGLSVIVNESVSQIDKLLEECHIFFKGVDGQMEGKR